ncbi:KAP family P-loop NTPase fold protein [Dyadobacter fermentans]|uniref:KAP P-loop domain protein n=1 Tax=Dyadobacter fermentans (strain ATCC 700827 / DSM 18053 / CIP 107007 / KCTC 52180 / NS114) TaxID=471854 RepID=C6VVU3_DYAFD|nr:P-loop NTPase fold protein [Dyadobacter fermentans]ACT91399.1 KAP P-loop domain protein [Dyadobacter fermentans DSM 18053]
MYIRHNDLVIPEENPFSVCKLDRKKYADVLTELVGGFGTGFVLALNSEWGTGKTTFVKMWRQDLQNAGFDTLYFNAWENDFESNPLVAIMSELKSLSKDKTVKFKSLIKKGAVLTKNLAPAVIKALASRYIDQQTLVDGLENASKAAAEILEKEIEAYANRKKQLNDFRKDLESFVNKGIGDKPVVFFIDELDRCRPSYAVEVLEHIKHFFAVSGIVFVLAIDKEQLGHAVRGVYGSEQIDASEYLRRFIDLEYSIPLPNTKHFVDHLYDFFAFDQFFKANERLQYNRRGEEQELFLSLAEVLFDKGKLTLRQQEKVFAHARMSLKSFSYRNYVLPSVFLLLVYLKSLKGDLYKSIQGREISLQDLSDKYSQIFQSLAADEYKINSLLHLQAQLLNLYNNYIHKPYGKQLVKRSSNHEIESMEVTSALDHSEGNHLFAEMIVRLNRDPDEQSISIEHLLNKINLTSPLVTK